MFLWRIKIGAHCNKYYRNLIFYYDYNVYVFSKFNFNFCMYEFRRELVLDLVLGLNCVSLAGLTGCLCIKAK